MTDHITEALNAFHNREPIDYWPTDLSNAMCPSCHITFWGRDELGAAYRMLAHFNAKHYTPEGEQ